MNIEKHTLENRLVIPKTALPCKALVSMIANQGTVRVTIRKQLSMIHVNFPDLTPEQHKQAQEFINNFMR